MGSNTGHDVQALKIAFKCLLQVLEESKIKPLDHRLTKHVADKISDSISSSERETKTALENLLAFIRK